MIVKPDIEVDPALVEEAVLLASEAASPPIRHGYRRERDAIYEIADSEKREAAFRDLDARWFDRLGLGTPLLRLVREFETVLARVSRCIVLLAGRTRGEGADLHDRRGGMAPSLRGELLHVEDMLDPAFDYQRDVPAPEEGAVYEKLLRDRYRVLWNTSVDGRLAARGQLAKGGEARPRQG